MNDFSIEKLPSQDFCEPFFDSNDGSTDLKFERQSFPEDVPQTYSGYLDIIITYPKYDDKELIPSVPVTFTMQGDVQMSSLLDFMASENFIGPNTMIFTYNSQISIWSYCGKFQAIQNTVVPAGQLSDFNGRKALSIKVREPDTQQPSTMNAKQCFSTTDGSRSMMPFGENYSTPIYSSTDDEVVGQDNLSNPGSTFKSDDFPQSPSSKVPRRRNQERLVSDVLEIIKKWRAFYNGTDENGEHVQLSLHDAADKVGVPKKSLDDYQMIIKKAKAFDFDFDKHLDCKFGVVRTFVRKNCGSTTRRRKQQKSKDAEEDQDYFYDQDKPKKCSKSKKIFKVSFQ
mmetsp:Transcript_28942/g.26293  ORF Transcript_28942/g.26293 Transcript_28942/m.26293 type:complete len:341 (+) Transcript_28942:98-1120(+)|eukprot:CAMPEP_0114597344 /NCGR_PEP_ID=MMETSP0125-20121206/19604_1 /TAXON_ID=485358 ORGANISM="Aristerostoma sp., Strain ATCC 50986" /NCGR_SAMPLE_ID=MMETSP0125 /ASSEMBLY_ACC=CAM_ASM_000245 /LENGTH=340 /DNA_ID=CAMNT_0001801761 /DNA_START=78 /DNA_END=1100 /DNA_ORIENTATION=+